MENIRHELEIHGTAVQAKNNLNILRRDDCASITIKRGERQLRFPFPTPTIVDGKRLKAGKFFIRFTTYDSSRIFFIKIMDGDKMLVLQNGLNWKGNSTDTNFEFPGAPLEVEWGINVIVGVHSNRDPARIDIIGLGIVFY